MAAVYTVAAVVNIVNLLHGFLFFASYSKNT